MPSFWSILPVLPASAASSGTAMTPPGSAEVVVGPDGQAGERVVDRIERVARTFRIRGDGLTHEAVSRARVGVVGHPDQLPDSRRDSAG